MRATIVVSTQTSNPEADQNWSRSPASSGAISCLFFSTASPSPGEEAAGPKASPLRGGSGLPPSRRKSPFPTPLWHFIPGGGADLIKGHAPFPLFPDNLSGCHPGLLFGSPPSSDAPLPPEEAPEAGDQGRLGLGPTRGGSACWDAEEAHVVFLHGHQQPQAHGGPFPKTGDPLSKEGGSPTELPRPLAHGLRAPGTFMPPPPAW